MRNFLATTKAFSEPTRLRMILALRHGELCVCELCDALGLVQSTLSTHLQYLRQAGLVETRNDGKWVYYRLTKSFARMTTALFRLHRDEIEGDPVLRTDRLHLQRRLALRDEGSCCLGFADKPPVKARVILRRTAAKP